MHNNISLCRRPGYIGVGGSGNGAVVVVHGCLPTRKIRGSYMASRLWERFCVKSMTRSLPIRMSPCSAVPGQYQNKFCRAHQLLLRWAITFFGGAMLGALSIIMSPVARAQRANPVKPIVVQPGPPGAPTKTLPSDTKATLPPQSSADVQFMQGMILHHAQAIEMTDMVRSHTDNKSLRFLGERISRSQTDEIKFMQRWLAARGQAAPKPMPTMAGMDMSQAVMALMPGMLTPDQMKALQKARGTEFDHLFLIGMIQHHNGALTMVKDLFETAGAGQDAELFNFATDADNTQRVEIGIMQNLLEKETSEEKR